MGRATKANVEGIGSSAPTAMAKPGRIAIASAIFRILAAKLVAEVAGGRQDHEANDIIHGESS